ncbi:DUF1127 domain-containing protein [Celeribacter indicus]|uniref:DUF1127 domain-containing protein n=1 Tax=Celeribacter indicus TaxID=1208324 RepID=UPI00089812B2|nr:DUF1127 domain-containing protein [Celeribacter indicus]SDW51953.1 protein of unknown function [Celeribacter indicus]
MTMFLSLRTAARKRAAYRRTLAELDALPARTKADLALDHGRACALARAAVYG